MVLPLISDLGFLSVKHPSRYLQPGLCKIVATPAEGRGFFSFFRAIPELLKYVAGMVRNREAPLLTPVGTEDEVVEDEHKLEVLFCENKVRGGDFGLFNIPGILEFMADIVSRARPCLTPVLTEDEVLDARYLAEQLRLSRQLLSKYFELRSLLGVSLEYDQTKDA